MTNLPQGWLTANEADELRRLAQGRTVLELGAWKGRSTVVLAQVSQYLVSIDKHEGISEVGGEDSLPEYLGNIRGFTNVGMVVAEFSLFVPWLKAFDMVYVDGNHDYKSVERDTILAKKTALHIIAFHDWDFVEVRDGAMNILKREPDGLVGSVAHFRISG